MFYNTVPFWICDKCPYGNKFWLLSRTFRVSFSPFFNNAIFFSFFFIRYFTSIFFFFQETIGLFGSAIAGIFILGIFIKKAHWKGALIGAIASITTLIFIKYSSPLNFYIYPLIGIPLCVIIGWVFSLLITIPQPDISGLVYQRKPTNITW